MPKPFLNLQRKEIACALARAGVSGRWIADYLGCDESTLRYALANDEAFRLRYRQARAELLIDRFTAINRAADKSWRAAKWVVEQAFGKDLNSSKSQPLDETEGDQIEETEVARFGPQILASHDDDTAASPAEPEPKMDLSSFQPAGLHASLARRGVLGETAANHRIEAAGDALRWPIGPDRATDTRQPRDGPWPGQPQNPILEKIIREGITGDKLEDFIRHEREKEARTQEKLDFCISGNNRR